VYCNGDAQVVIGDMPEFDNYAAALPDEPSFMPAREPSRTRSLSSGSSHRSGGDECTCDHVVCPTCRGTGHITNGLALRLCNVYCVRWLSGVVVNGLELGLRGPGFASWSCHYCHCVAILGKLFTDVASTVFSAPRNWDTKGSGDLSSHLYITI